MVNFLGVNLVIGVLIDMQKLVIDCFYLLFFFLLCFQVIMCEGNKVVEDKVLVGDIIQFNVDVYKDMVLKIGYNLDDFQCN